MLALLFINSNIKIKDHSESRAIYYHFRFIFQAFQTFDAEKTNTVTQCEFKRALESFCIPLTEDQFDKLIKKVKIKNMILIHECILLYLTKDWGLHQINY